MSAISSGTLAGCTCGSSGPPNEPWLLVDVGPMLVGFSVRHCSAIRFNAEVGIRG